MDNNTVTELLNNFRSYKFAVMNLRGAGENDAFVVQSDKPFKFLPIYEDRKPRFISRYNISYDFSRYQRIVEMVESAVNYVLSDDERTIIMRKYIDRNRMTLSEIADAIHQDRKTVGTKHKKAINQLAKALVPISEDYLEITNFDHMFDSSGRFQESA